MPNGTEKCCGTCRWFNHITYQARQWDGWGTCTWPVPPTADSLTYYIGDMEESDGTTCPCHTPKEPDKP